MTVEDLSWITLQLLAGVVKDRPLDKPYIMVIDVTAKGRAKGSIRG